jgi:hypothetical protein
MPEYRRVEDSIEVPKNTGVTGFLRTLEQIIRLPRVQDIRVDIKGKVSWSRYVLDGESEPLGVEFEDLEPWAIIRNSEVVELPVRSTNVALVLSMMLDKATSEALHPIAFASGADTVLWEWFADSTGYRLGSNNSVMGLPLYLDRHAPDTALILCAAYTKGAALIDTQKAYKIEMDYTAAPGTYVEVFGDG